MYDDRVNEPLDLTVYLDITDDVKFAWKAQRHRRARRHHGGGPGRHRRAQAGLRRVRRAAEGEGGHHRAVLLSDLIDDPTGKFLKVKLIQSKDAAVSAYFFDEGASIEWTPNAKKLTTNAPGVDPRTTTSGTARRSR